MKYLEMVGQLKHGPKEKQKDGTYKQRVVADSFGEDILKFKTDLAKTADKLEDREIERIKKDEENEIIKAITENPNSFSVADDLLKRFPTRREFLYDQIEIYADSRDELFNSFNYKVSIGYYGNDVVRMLSELDSYKGMIGPTWTDEDEKRYKESAAIARSYSPKNVGNFNNRIKDMHREVRSLLGAKGEYNNTWDENKRDKLQQYLDLKTYINNRIMDEIDLSPGTPREKEERFREIKAEYYQDVEAILGDTYKLKGSLLTEEQRVKEDGIQALVDDYGLGIEDATKIYDEEFVETVIGEEEPEETEEDKEKSWLDLLLERFTSLEPNDKDQLVGQLNNAKENLGENESTTGVIDSVLNALMGSVTAGDLEDKLTSYTVEAGDTLSGLADQFKTSVKEIMDANNITNEDFINIGQQLLMPINTIGDALVPESDLKNPSVLDEIDITKPFKYDSLNRLAQEVGFSPEDARIAAAIALAESSGRAGIDTVKSGLDKKKKNEFSLGLWQIDMQDKPGYMLGTQRRDQFGIESNEELYNPLTNAKAAKMIFDTFGFEPWATYTSGKYKDFLPKTN